MGNLLEFLPYLICVIVGAVLPPLATRVKALLDKLINRID